jgi:hypothetical protein
VKHFLSHQKHVVAKVSKKNSSVKNKAPPNRSSSSSSSSSKMVTARAKNLMTADNDSCVIIIVATILFANVELVPCWSARCCEVCLHGHLLVSSLTIVASFPSYSLMARRDELLVDRKVQQP